MRHFTKLCYVAAAVCVLVGIFFSLPPLGWGRIDDWQYSGGLFSPPALMLTLAVVIASLPFFCRVMSWILRRRFWR